MAVFRNQQLVFLHIPKTAGRAIKTYFKERENGHVDMSTPHLFAWEYVSQGYLSEDEWGAFDKLTVVRNPWARAVSAYKYKCRNPKNRMFDSFEAFLEAFIQGGWKLRRHGEPQVKFLEGFDGRIIRYERLNEAFPDLPRMNVSSNITSYRDFYTDETRQIIADAYAQDIARFGYTFDNGDMRDATSPVF